MDLYEIIHTLHQERQRLDRIIRRVQELQRPAPAGRKRLGRVADGKRKTARRGS